MAFTDLYIAGLGSYEGSVPVCIVPVEANRTIQPVPDTNGVIKATS